MLGHNIFHAKFKKTMSVKKVPLILFHEVFDNLSLSTVFITFLAFLLFLKPFLCQSQ